MKAARLSLLGLALALLAACGSSDPTGVRKDGGSEPPVTTQDCGYLGSAGCS
jgi:hypothetical protein